MTDVPSEAEFHLVHSLDDGQVRQLVELYQHEWWSRGRSESDVRRMLAGCDLLFALFEPNHGGLAAFARVLSDFVYKAFVFDVIVDRRYRGRGLGDRLLHAITRHSRLARVQTIELYCRPELVPFYERWGFGTDVAGCVFMRRTPPEDRDPDGAGYARTTPD